ncbi:hypothetical protein [Mycobacteroides abscessus]|uniref:hypothetical protein n=1 Tax=Mycobacteroides abscessus TaxID=36809 RepID=UPI0009A80EA7|nr:hypothetical protein [Mycobacteroides abscessus]SKF78790.1 Uncharacterised protein [Mycobacteroides abscessus subsp. bolletii]SKG54646.1 Uncharacterised protein [Mycobacteroides abscessus subsp. bolletii]SKG85381.1 Uncharacterised protein [Mycobacteroides abscessus subsp. bolletii]SKG92360.1 Uncharacterised protein [Mycobacteroides abscessus subsp. bolletii]SKH28156.1 Uncharacterised protein [Mycobacteroides abscessus subsp. bolletii]
MSELHVVPVAPGIFVNGKPVVAVSYTPGSTQKSHFLVIDGKELKEYGYMKGRVESLAFTGGWEPPAKPTAPGLTQISATNPVVSPPPPAQ